MSDTPKPTKLSDDELAVDIAEIPLPPEELWDELDNTPAATKPAPARPPADVAVLEFVDGGPGTDVVLDYPFRLDGAIVDRVRVRPLTVSETSAVVTRRGVEVDAIDFYAEMTGLPAVVIRALPGLDGERVTGVAYGFLPRFMKGAD